MSEEELKIREVFDLFDNENKRMISKDDCGTVMRYLGAFPTEEELVKEIIPSLLLDDSLLYIPLDKFEPFMLGVMRNHKYEPDTEELLLEAFKTLDSEGKGYLLEEEVRQLLTEGEWGFREKEFDDFIRFAKDTSTGYIHYSEYINI